MKRGAITLSPPISLHKLRHIFSMYVTKLLYVPILCKLLKNKDILNWSQQMHAKYLSCWRKICLCVCRQKYFLKEVSVGKMPVSTMSVGEIASYVRKCILALGFFFQYRVVFFRKYFYTTMKFAGKKSTKPVVFHLLF